MGRYVPFFAIAVLSIAMSCFEFTPIHTAWAQEAGAEDPPAPATETGESAPAEENAGDGDQPADSAEPATGETQPAGPAEEAFNTIFAQWKALLSEIRDIRAEYYIAENDRAAELKEQYVAKIDEGRQIEPQLQNAAIAAFQESPNTNRELVRFLITLAADDIRSDDYRSANELTSILQASDCDEKELADLAGIAAYGTNQFEDAKKYLQQAEEEGSLSANGAKFLSEVDVCQSTWEKEQELRKEEAEKDDLPRVKLQTDVGDIVLELFENEAPETVGNFISLVEKGFYDGRSFHRVIGAFMAQGGCPNDDGSGGPGYNIYCECTADNHRNHFAGSLSMAKQTARNTGGSQFFLTFVPTPFLNGQHTVFGRLLDGWDTLSKIEKRDPNGAPPLAKPTTIVKAEVIRKRDHEYRPNKVR